MRLIPLLLLCLTLSPLAHAGAPVPDFSLPTDDAQFTLSEHRGKVVYVDFWASWCPPCRQSFPWMEAMQAKYADQGLVIVAVNLDKDLDKVAAFLNDNGSPLTIAYDPEGNLAERFGVQAMPTSFIIDREGLMQANHQGFRERDKAALEQQIRALLQ